MISFYYKIIFLLLLLSYRAYKSDPSGFLFCLGIFTALVLAPLIITWDLIKKLAAQLPANPGA